MSRIPKRLDSIRVYMHTTPMKCICTHRDTPSADDHIRSAAHGAEAINAHHRSSSMKTGILSLGLTLSGAILAAQAGAAHHADSSALGSAQPPSSTHTPTRHIA